jgi:hypothetical protein
MLVGDKVLLKPSSQLRHVLGDAASAVGVVSGVDGLRITVDYPELGVFTQLLPASDFSRFGAAAADPAKIDQFQALVEMVDSHPVLSQPESIPVSEPQAQVQPGDLSGSYFAVHPHRQVKEPVQPSSFGKKRSGRTNRRAGK